MYLCIYPGAFGNGKSDLQYLPYVKGELSKYLKTVNIVKKILVLSYRIAKLMQSLHIKSTQVRIQVCSLFIFNTFFIIYYVHLVGSLLKMLWRSQFFVSFFSI